MSQESNKEKMKVWNHASKTDLSAAKEDTNGGYKSTSINGYWMFEKATEIWGPIGTGWGYHIVSEDYIDGPPMNDIKSGSLVCMSKNCILKIKLWYDSNPEMQGVHATGNCKYMYMTAGGKVITDLEASKKAATDAMKKALSFLGFSADIYKGMHENREYVEEQKIVQGVEKSSDKDAQMQIDIDDIAEYVRKNCQTIQGAQSKYELNSIRKICIRHLDTKSKIPHINKVCIKGIAQLDKLFESKKLQLEDSKKGSDK